MRILLHPGFHKTGTSSLQGGVQTQTDRLSEFLQFRNTADLRESARAARRFSARPEKINLWRFAIAFRAELGSVQRDGPQALLISSEDLCGTLPGLRGVLSYEAVPSLMNVAVAVLKSCFGNGAEITLWFTTRTGENWLRSVWYQNLRAQRLTEDFETFRLLLARAAELDAVVARVAARIALQGRVISTPIETCGAPPLGPLGAALDLLDIRTEGLPPLPARNAQPEGAAEELLALNRSDLADEALVEAKREVLRRYRRAGQTRRPDPQRIS